MNEENRPDPEELLKSIKREETTRGKGKLKIFLGMSAGVGKTYAMLEAAQKLQRFRRKSGEHGVSLRIRCSRRFAAYPD